MSAERVGRLSGYFRGTGGATVVIAAIAVLARIAFVHDPPSPDEGGYLVVAKNWDDEGPFTYGHLFVDRPPLLLLTFRVADLLGGLTPLRWIACGGVLAAVVAAAWAGNCVAGRLGARWAALTAAALMTTPMLDAHEVDGELIAAPLVLLSCACLLDSLRRDARWRSVTCAAAAGASGTLAALVKQNFVDALVFGVVVLLVSAVIEPTSRRQTAWRAGGFVLGALVPIVTVVAWATHWGPGVGALLYATYGFRTDASHTLLSYSFAAPSERLRVLGGVALSSGILVLGAVFLARFARGPRRDALALGVAALFLTSSVGILLGLDYWVHYLIQLVPAAALASACLARRAGWLRRTAQVAVGYVVAASLLSTGYALLASPSGAARADDASVDQWISTAARPADTVLVTYGHADFLYESGLSPADPFIWSLPLRTLDPQLHGLIRRVDSRRAPVWILDWSGFDTWRLDPTGRLARSVSSHYHQVITVCGVTMYLHDGVHRRTPPIGGCPQ